MTTIPPKTRKQIADEYGWSISTLRRRLKANGVNLPSGCLLATHQKLIYEYLSYPVGVAKEEYQEIELP